MWDEEDYGIIAKQACWSMTAIMAVIGFRIYCRVGFGRNVMGLDDWITILCLVVFIVDGALMTKAIHYGLGKHIGDISHDDSVLALKWSVISSTVVIWTFSLPKFAVVAIIRRILNLGTKTAVLCWGLCITSQLCIFGVSVWWVHQCSPPERGWDASVDGTCAPVSVLQNLSWFTTVFSTFLDVFFAIYPIPFIMKLNMPLKNRVTISAALSLQTLASGVAIYKLSLFPEVFAMLPTDPTYPIPYFNMLGFAEGFVLILGSSFPALGPMFRAIRRKVTTAISSKDASGKSQERSRSGRWNNFRSHRVEEPRQMADSVDEIPLYPMGATMKLEESGIWKTVHITQSVS